MSYMLHVLGLAVPRSLLAHADKVIERGRQAAMSVWGQTRSSGAVRASSA